MTPQIDRIGLCNKPHLALQHAAVGGASQLLQGFGRGTVERLRQQEAQAAGREAAEAEDGEGHRGVEGPLVRYTHTHTKIKMLHKLI